jgi:hypothetical protein
MHKFRTQYLPLFTASALIGFAATRLYFHDMWAFVGFTIAAVATGLAYLQGRYIIVLLHANKIMSESMSNLIRDLQASGIMVTEEEAEGPTEMRTARLIRKDVH